MIEARAVLFAIRYHGQQARRVSGEPYVCHPIRVAMMTEKYVHPSNLKMVQRAALFHDLLEDTHCTEQELRSVWGDAVADLVVGLTNEKPKDRELKAQLERRRFLGASNILRVIKFCDVIDNAQSFGTEVGSKWCRRWVAEKKLLCEVLNTSVLTPLYDRAVAALKEIDK